MDLVRGADDLGHGAYNFVARGRLGERRRLRPRTADGVAGRLARVKQKRNVTLGQHLRDRRRRVATQPQIQHGRRELLAFRKFERLLKR